MKIDVMGSFEIGTVIALGKRRGQEKNKVRKIVVSINDFNVENWTIVCR